LERISLGRDVLILHWAMTDVALQASLNVNGMVEENEIWELIDPIPLYWNSCLIALSDWLKERRVCPDLAMAAHACFGRRNTSVA
jgi:hypothetical protein